MDDEVHSLVENKTWDLVDRLKDRVVLTGKWVYKHKRGPNGEILRYKSRWVVRGFEQREGLDYNETFALVVKPMSYKLRFAIAAAYDLEIEQMNIKTAFLYGNIDTEVYVEQPQGLEAVGQKTKVCKLNKALYVLKQFPAFDTLPSRSISNPLASNLLLPTAVSCTITKAPISQYSSMICLLLVPQELRLKL
jgi:hypothetical protein